jgi:cellulose biosynthesis protein BcsQ
MTSRFDFLPARPGGGLVDLRGNDLQVAGTIEDRLESFGKQYDFVVIDAPVGDDVLLRMALSSASDLLIPITPGFFSISSVESEMKIHHCVDRKCLNSIRTSLILNMYDHRNRFSREMQKRLRANWPDIVLDSFIRHSIKIPEAASFGQPLSVYDARTAANEDFSALASEMQSLGTRSIRRAMMENENFNHLRLVELPSSRIAKFPRIPSGVDDRADGRFAEKDKARSAFVGVVDQES